MSTKSRGDFNKKKYEFNKQNTRYKKNFYNKPRRFLTKEEKEKIFLLDKQIKEINNKISSSEKNLANRETAFRDSNLNKELTIFTKYGQEIKGTLVDIDKYRLHIKVEGKLRYFYKHSLLGYSSNEN